MYISRSAAKRIDMSEMSVEELVIRKYENEFVRAGDCMCILDKMESENLLDFNRDSAILERIKKVTCETRNR